MNNLLVTIWNIFLLTGIVWLIEARGWSCATLLWIFLIGGTWK
jgi:hypothetical protein